MSGVDPSVIIPNWNDDRIMSGYFAPLPSVHDHVYDNKGTDAALLIPLT